VDTSNVTGVFSKRDYSVCKALDKKTILHPSGGGFEYGWTDACYEDSCAVEIRLTFDGPEITGLTNGKSDHLDMVMHGTLAGDPANSNPFAISRDVNITSLNLNYLKTGSTRSVAVCEYYITPSEDNPPAQLISEPVSSP
jgi:hypothetical protein